MGFSLTSKGSFDKTVTSLKKMVNANISGILEAAGQEGVNALASVTPEESGLAARSWYFTIENENGSATIVWQNTDVEEGFPVVIMLQFGYATGTGGYVEGRDFINSAMRPIFDNISDRVWKAVTSA